MTVHHDHDHPFSQMHKLEAAWLASDSTVPRCPHCHTTAALLPMTGTAWGLDVTHEADCPTHEDNQPTPTRPTPPTTPEENS